MSSRYTDISTLHPLLLRLVIAVGLLVAASCTDRADEPGGGSRTDQPVGTISLYLNMGDSYTPSRSASRTPLTDPDKGQGYDPGSGFENYIDPADFRLYAFDGSTTDASDNATADSKLYCLIPPEDITIVPLSFEADNRHYVLSFPISEEFKTFFETHRLKLVMLANWHGSYPDVAPRTSASTPEGAAEGDTPSEPSTAKTTLTPDVSTISDLVSCREAMLDYSVMSPAPDRSNLIPLFGVNDYGTITGIESGKTHWLETLNLLRALAKVEVYDAPGSNVHIRSARITRYNTSLYMAPHEVYDEDDYVKNDYGQDYGPAPTIPLPSHFSGTGNPGTSSADNYESSSPITMQHVDVANDDGTTSRHFIIYVPEYRNLTSPTTARNEKERMRIEIEYDELEQEDAREKPRVGETDEENKYIQKKFYIEFGEYELKPSTQKTELKNYFDVKRNYWYQFEIKKTTKVMNVVANIQPYAEVIVTPPLGLDRDPDGNIITQRYPNGTYDVIVDNKTIRRDEDGDKVIKEFSDGSLLCEEVVKKDYIHDDSEKDYAFPFEKEFSGGNMIIIRQKSAGGAFHGEIDNSDAHDHGMDDRALFILDKKGDFYYVTYNPETKEPSYSPNDMKGDKIIQVNGFQFRNKDEMKKYIGSYVVEIKGDDDKTTQELRYYKDGSKLDWETGVPKALAEPTID